MPRSGDAARERLEAAALHLFSRHGFDSVTTAQIAERAGVTERTYFRHFPDKREVLFEGERRLVEWVSAAFDAVPLDVGSLAAVHRVSASIAPRLEENRAQGDQLALILRRSPALAERAVAKEAHLVQLVTARLQERGAEPHRAAITARAGWGALAEAVRAWREHPDVPLQQHVNVAFAILADVAAEAPAGG